MIRAFINLFLTLILPIGALFITVGVLYYLKDFELTKAMKLGVLTGILSAIAFSLVAALLIIIKRTFQIYRYQRLHTQEQNNAAGYESHSAAMAATSGYDPLVPKEGENRYILLMECDVAFEVALYAIKTQKIGIIHKADKHHGEIIIRQKGRYVPIRLSRLTPHSSHITIERMENVDPFIHTIKEKEFAFLEYV